MSAKETTSQMLQALIEHVGTEVICVEEMPFGNGKSRCDLWTIHPWMSKKYKTVAYELKVSRSDFKNDSYEKQKLVLKHSQQFYYVTPAGLIEPHELPDWAGLIEWHGDNTFKTVIRSVTRPEIEASMSLIVNALRYSTRVRRDTSLMRAELNIAKNEVKRLKHRVKMLISNTGNVWG